MKKTSLFVGVIIVVVLIYLFFVGDKDESIIKQPNPKDIDEHDSLSTNSMYDGKDTVRTGKIMSTPPVIEKNADGEFKVLSKEKTSLDSSNYLDNIQQDELTEEMLAEIEKDIKNNKLELGDIGGISPSGLEKLNNSNLQDTISLNELPAKIASEVRRDIEFRKENGYDKASQRESDEILSAIGQISGSDIEIPNLQFNVSLLPRIITENYQYLGYIYPYQGDQSVTYSSVKRVFSHFVDNSILLIKEDDLKNGSATLITEFVNARVFDCPAMVVEKRDDVGRSYGQINWNTRQIGYTIYQFNKENPTSSLLEIANAIYLANRSVTNCEPQGESQDSNTDELPKL